MALRPKSSLKKYLTKPKENGRETRYVTYDRGIYFGTAYTLYTFSMVPSSPMARMDFMWAGPQAAFIATTSLQKK